MATRWLLHARGNAKLLERASAFLASQVQKTEVVILAPTRAAAAELAITASEHGCQGAHAFTLTQLAANIAAQPMARAELAPISRLGIEAIATRVVHVAQRAKALHYFAPVAQTPGFPRALANTIAELRLQGVKPKGLAATGAPGADLAHLMKLYQRELQERSLADLPILLALATAETERGAHRFAGLPLLLLDLTVEWQGQEKLLAALIAKSPAVLATAITGNEHSLAPILEAPPEDLDLAPAATTLDRVRTWLFSPEQPPTAPPDLQLLFSAPGENLECVEIARRIRALAGQGVTFDRIAILLRNVEQYQPLVEEALRRAARSGWPRLPGPAGLCRRWLLRFPLRRVSVAGAVAASR